MAPLFILLACVPFLVAASAMLNQRSNGAEFITVQNGQFFVNGTTFFHYGTNIFWANMLTDDDLDATFSSIVAEGIQVVRVWAFNDVSEQPSSGSYFQILQNGTATINEGVDGLQRLDRVVARATKFGIKLVLTLTNNWNPVRTAAVDQTLPRGTLSNDYGGMDMYVNTFCPGGTHDVFYTDETIIKAFKNYISHVIPRYANSSTILGWELANDPRCSSTLPASSKCNTHTITSWVADIAGFVKTLDNRHLVTAGDGGFYCKGCPKLFASGSSKSKRLYEPTGPGFDGSFGVDTEDIISIPAIDFGSFQYFPDQFEYFSDVPSNSTIAAIGQGNAWVAAHSDTATSFAKPETLTAFTIVTQSDVPNFVPFNGTHPVPGGPVGATGNQKDYMFASWGTSGVTGNVGGMLEYQMLEGGLIQSSMTKRVVFPNVTGGPYGDITTLNLQSFQSKNPTPVT